MKVAIDWLKEFVELNVTYPELVTLFNHKTIGTKEVTEKFIELDMKGYNRADLLSLRGVAYEVAAITESRVLFNEENAGDFYWVEKSLPPYEITVENSADCPVYCLVKIEGLTVAPSGQEWAARLTDSGFRTVNNLADITNLVMLEYGQPMHAFDGGQIKGDKIIVRRARSGEKITTLDNKIRELSPDDLVIADTEKPVGIAGVMGGKDSEISDTTTTVLLEAAIFDPVMLRKTANKLALNSEAGKRFYHGLTGKRLTQALNAAINMYTGLGGKVTALTIYGESADQLKKIPVRLDKINSLIGEIIPPEQAEQYFKRLNFELTDKVISGDKSSYVVTPPYYRLDLEVEEDIVEEAARMFGYENIKSSSIPTTEISGADQKKFRDIRQLKQYLVSLGLTEVFTYPYYSTGVLEALGFDTGSKQILNRIANPISRETEYLRLNLWPNLLEAAARNYRQGIKDLAIFELGKVYSINKDSHPEEKYHLAILLINGETQPILEIQSIINKFLSQLADKLELEKSTPKNESVNFFHPVRFLDLKYRSESVGGISEIHPKLADLFKLGERIAVAEIDISEIKMSDEPKNQS